MICIHPTNEIPVTEKSNQEKRVGKTKKRGQTELDQKTYSVWTIPTLDPGAVKQKPDAIRRLPLAITERVHQLLQLGCALDLEEDFVVAVCDLDIEMLVRRLLRLGGGDRSVVGTGF